MFKMITWPQYLFAVTALLVLYYAYVALVYYRAELTGLLTGKGKAANNQASAPAPTSLLNRGPLIPKAAVMPPLPEPSETPTTPAIDTQMNEVGEEDLEQDAVETRESTATREDIKKYENDFISKKISNTDKFSMFTDDKLDVTASTIANEGADGLEKFDEDFTVGVTQLNSYFERAAEGEITQEQLVKEVPALKNTDVLVAFFKNSTKNAQQLTAATYAETDEPALS